MSEQPKQPPQTEDMHQLSENPIVPPGSPTTLEEAMKVLAELYLAQAQAESERRKTSDHC